MLTAREIPVLMFGWELPPYNTGGLGVACYGLARGLSSLGLPISFALPRKLPISAPFMHLVTEGLESVSITAINSLLQAYLDAPHYTTLNAQNVSGMFGGSIYDEAMRFGELAREWSVTQKHTIVHAHDWMSYPAAMKSHGVSGKPWVAHIHATEYDRTGDNVNPQIAEIEYEGLQNASKIIAVSAYTKAVVQKRYSIASDKIEVIHNGIDMSEFQPSAFRQLFPNDNVVLFVGRLTFQKGIEYFLRAARRVLEISPNTVFIVAGTGDLEERLIMESSALGIGGRVFFPGFMSGEKLKSLYQMADVFVMPSVSEPYGIVALEAVAMGVPTIISKQSGVAETIANISTVDFWDIDKMSRMILASLNYPSFSRDKAAMAKTEASALTWDLAAQKTLSVYHSLLD